MVSAAFACVHRRSRYTSWPRARPDLPHTSPREVGASSTGGDRADAMEILWFLPAYFRQPSVVSVTVARGRVRYVDTHACFEGYPTGHRIIVAGSGFLPRFREASDERIQSLDRRSGMLRVLRQAAAGHQWPVAAVARRERPVLL
jgi:hypothetical protein